MDLGLELLNSNVVIGTNLTFGYKSGVKISTSTPSRTVVWSGPDGDLAFDVGTVSVNGAAAAASPVAVVDGDLLIAYVTSSGSYETGVTMTFTMAAWAGDTFIVTTEAEVVGDVTFDGDTVTFDGDDVTFGTE